MGEPKDRPGQSLPRQEEANAPVLLPVAFFDNDGLRVGWRLAIYAAGYYVLRDILLLVLGSFTEGMLRLWIFFWGECLLFLAAVIPAVALSKLEGRRFGDYGLPRAGAFGRNFWVGAVWGFAGITCLLLLMKAAGAFGFGGVVLHGPRVLKFAMFWATLFLVVGFYEDFLYRGYAQFTLAQGIGFWPSAILLSAVFGAIHLTNPGEQWAGALGAAAIGLFFCLTLRRTGNLWFAIGMHAAWDWGETFFYSVPDSGLVAPGHLMNPSFHGSRWLTGGTVGPEGSVLLFVLIAAMWVLFDRVYPAKRTA
jgi:hypothetical protein